MYSKYLLYIYLRHKENIYQWINPKQKIFSIIYQKNRLKKNFLLKE